MRTVGAYEIEGIGVNLIEPWKGTSLLSWDFHFSLSWRIAEMSGLSPERSGANDPGRPHRFDWHGQVDDVSDVPCSGNSRLRCGRRGASPLLRTAVAPIGAMFPEAVVNGRSIAHLFHVGSFWPSRRCRRWKRSSIRLSLRIERILSGNALQPRQPDACLTCRCCSRREANDPSMSSSSSRQARKSRKRGSLRDPI